MPINEPVPANDRGFLVYAGGPIATDYGHTIRVQESSSAEGPKVWLFTSESKEVSGRDPHLNLSQAIVLREALDQFIQGTATRWSNGAELLAEAHQSLGLEPPSCPGEKD